MSVSSTTNNISSVMYNSVSLTQIGSVMTNTTAGRYISQWGLVNPIQGSNQVTISGGTNHDSQVISLLGVDTITPYTNVTTSNGTSTTPSITLTTTATGSYVFGLEFHPGSVGTGGTDTTQRNTASTNDYQAYWSSTNPVNSASGTLSVTISSTEWNFKAFSLNPATITYLQTASSSTDLSSYSFTSQNFGPALSSRQIICCVSGRTQDGSSSGSVVSSVTIGGISATLSVQGQNTGNTQCIAIASVPTGTSGTVDVVFAETMTNADISLYSAINVSTTASDTGTSTASVGTYDLDVPAGGVAVAMMKNDDGSLTATWAGLTETYDAQDANGNDISGSASAFATTQTNLTVSCTWSGTPVRPIYAVASYSSTITSSTSNMFLVM